MKLLEGKVALITGAGRGIGKAVAAKLAENGADIAFTDLEINETVEATAEELRKWGTRVEAYASNAADFEQTHAKGVHVRFFVVHVGVYDFGRHVRNGASDRTLFCAV